LLFQRESPLQMLHAHAYEPVVPISEFQKIVPADLRQVILRCLEKDPDHRYQDVTTLDKALAACECAGRWTPERAEEWWRQNGISGRRTPSPEAIESSPTVVATA